MSRWWIVAAGFLCFVGEAMGTYVFTPTLKPIVEEFGWTRTQFTLSGLFLSLVMMASVPAAGILTDRGHARLVLSFGALCLGAALYLFSLMRSLPQFYLVTALMGLGVGCIGGIPVTAVLSHWFDERRGLALGLAGLGHSLGGLVLPLAVTGIVARQGWREAFSDLALVAWLAVLPVVFLVMRAAPAGGRTATGVTAHAAAAGAHAASAAVADGRVPLGSAIRSRAFWFLSLAMFLHIAYFSGVTVHFIALATDVGFDAQTAATAFGALLALGVPGRLIFGWAADRFPKRAVAVIALLGTVAASLLLQDITAWGALPAFVVAQGLSVVGVQTLFGLLVGEAFGALNVGTVLGATMLFQVPGGVLGAIAAAASFDRLGTYGPAFWLFTVGNAVAAAAIAALRPYAPEQGPMSRGPGT